MRKERIVLFTAPSDQGDILQDFLDWHLDLGIDSSSRWITDRPTAAGSCSSATRRPAASSGSRSPNATSPSTHSPTNWPPSRAIATRRDWIIHCDVDEFLCTHGRRPPRRSSRESDRDGVTLMNVPRRTMTGSPDPARPAGDADADACGSTGAVEPTSNRQISGTSRCRSSSSRSADTSPFARRRSASYGPARIRHDHVGHERNERQLYILHYAMRGYEALRTKVEQHRGVARRTTRIFRRLGLALASLDPPRKRRDGCARTTISSSSRPSARASSSNRASASSMRPLPRGSHGRQTRRRPAA